MSKVFEGTMNEISKASGCDYNFVVEMFEYINNSHGYIDMERFAYGVMKMDWSARNGGKFEDVLSDLASKSGYNYDILLAIFTEMVYDPDSVNDWNYFVGVTMEKDW